MSKRGGIRRTVSMSVALSASLAVCLVAATGALAAPPADDSFSAPIPITLNSTILATNVEATKETGEPNHAGNAGGHSVWFSWTAPATAAVGVSTQCGGFGGGFESLLAVYTGSAVNALTPIADSAGLTGVGCNPFGEPPEVLFEAQAGVEYRIAVDGKNGSVGSFELKLSGAPVNDDFAAATVVPAEPPQIVSATTRHATAQAGEPLHAEDGEGHSVWFTWTPNASGPVIVSTCGPFSNLDSVLAVYTGSAVNALTPVGSNDDAFEPGTFPECRNTDSEVRLSAVAGTTYRIAVDSTGGTAGRFNLRIKGRPANDTFAAATVLGPGHSGGTGVTDNKLATKEAGEPDHAGDPGGHSVWYSWTPTAPGPVTFVACPVSEGQTLETVTAVYTGSAVNALTPVAVSNDEAPLSCGSSGSEASFTAEAGITYHVAVDGKEGTEGQFQLSVSGPGANDSFAEAQGLPSLISTSTWGSVRGATAQPGEPDPTGVSAHHSVWFSWEAPVSGPYVMSACQYGEFHGDPLLSVYTGSAVGALTAVAADAGGGSYCNPRAAQVEFTATAGTVYRIAVDANGGGGYFSLNLDGTPANDDFGAAQVLPGEPTIYSGSTRFASKQAGEPDHAGDPGGRSVWYSWTPSASGPVAILACPGRSGGPFRTPGGIDALLAVYTGDSVGGLTEVTSDHGGPVTETFACELGGVTGASEVHLDAVAGTTYKIAVDAAGAGEGPFTLGFERSALNDSFAAPASMEGNLPLYGNVDNRFAGSEAGEPTVAGVAGGHSVWFKWTPSASGPVWISTCTYSGHLDSLLGVYTGGAVGALTPVASDDDGPPREEGCRATDSGVEVNAVAGTTYRIDVDGKGGTVGTTSLKIEGTPADDDFGHAQSLGAVRSTLAWVSNRFATGEPSEPDIAGQAHSHSVWFKWTAPRTAQFTFDTCGSAIDTLLGVFTGAPVGSLTEVAENDDAGGECGGGSRVVFNATAGTVYRIAVDGKAGAVGAISLHLDGVPANDQFAAAEVIQPEGSYLPGSTTLATPEAGEPAPGGHSVWYSWTPDLSGPASVEACGVGFTPSFAVFTGSEPTALTAVPTVPAGSADCDHGTEVEFSATAGTTYRIEVGGSEGGRFELRLLGANGLLHLLTVRTAGAGAGTVTASTAGIACGATCRYDLAPGTALTLVAEPGPGSAFSGWSGGGCSGTGPCTVTFRNDATVTAHFGTGTGGSDGESPPLGQPTLVQPPRSEAPIGPITPKKPPHCRKGFKKVSSHGKAKCVKKATPKPTKHKKHHPKKKTKKPRA